MYRTLFCYCNDTSTHQYCVSIFVGRLRCVYETIQLLHSPSNQTRLQSELPICLDQIKLDDLAQTICTDSPHHWCIHTPTPPTTPRSHNLWEIWFSTCRIYRCPCGTSLTRARVLALDPLPSSPFSSTP